jgi:hypothetical protein
VLNKSNYKNYILLTQTAVIAPIQVDSC